MELFATAFQQTAHLDGIVFKFDTQDEQHRQSIATKMKGFIKAHWVTDDPKEFGRCFKVKVFNMTTDRSRCIMKLSLFGPALNTVAHFPAALLANLHEAHYKAYGDLMDAPRTKALYDRLIWATKGRQPTMYGEHPNPNSRKGSGVGVRIGDRNSDYGFVFYRRPNERLGLELRIRDKACWRRASKALDFAVAYGQDDAAAWQIVHRTLMHAAAEEFVRDLRGKGVDLAEFFPLVDQKREDRHVQQVPFRFDTGDSDDVKTWTALPLDL